MIVLEAIGERAASGNLTFLIAGGHAVIAHGYARTTFDLDLIIRELMLKHGTQELYEKIKRIAGSPE